MPSSGEKKLEQQRKRRRAQSKPTQLIGGLTWNPCLVVGQPVPEGQLVVVGQNKQKLDELANKPNTDSFTTPTSELAQKLRKRRKSLDHAERVQNYAKSAGLSGLDFNVHLERTNVSGKYDRTSAELRQKWKNKGNAVF